MPAAPQGDILPFSFEQSLLASRGKPFVFSEGDTRSLHFEEKYVQSEMWLAAPYELALSYTRVMMEFRQFTSSPQHVLMIGLGGGSLAKYCYRNLPSTRITVVEKGRADMEVRLRLLQDEVIGLRSIKDSYVASLMEIVQLLQREGLVVEDHLIPLRSSSTEEPDCS